MSPYSVSEAQPQLPNVFLDIIGLYGLMWAMDADPQTRIFGHRYCCCCNLQVHVCILFTV